MKQTFVIIGTDTGVGKTVLTALLARFLRERGVRVAALKPICSGGREDAHVLHKALGGALRLEEINPWHFRASVAPTLAAQREKQTVKLAQVVAQVRAVQRKFEVTLIESAGGVLSPLGEDFDTRDLLAALRARPIVVAQNKLGAVNQVRLTLAALPARLRAQAEVVLMSPPEPDAATATNAALLERWAAQTCFRLPWLGDGVGKAEAVRKLPVRRTLSALLSI